MKSVLEQCCDDAWDVIQGRKRIARNRIIDVDPEKSEEKVKSDYGWLSPDGVFYPIEFGNHQAWAAEYLLKLYREGKISYEQANRKDNGNVGDLLTDMGWILIHNPHGYGFKITRNLSKRVTNKQKDYLRGIGKIDLLEKEFV